VRDYIGQRMGNYTLTRLLGRGGFAEVYLGEHRYLGSKAAIKVLNLQADQRMQKIIAEEARTSARLDHPHIARTLPLIWAKLRYLDTHWLLTVGCH